MTLAKYKKKRNFNQTPEPKGKRVKKNNEIKKSSKLHYFIQKHDASHLHYDFRLELNGVLLSWAIPKGPCLDPTIKRLAMHVEDHPVEYGSFEGTIPKGQYGGGTVMLWDTGKWISEDDDPYKSYQQGQMKFKLKGKRLNGLWKLIRINKNDKTWLLIKLKDEFSKNIKNYDITLEEDKSVLSHQRMQEIKTCNNPDWSNTHLSKRTKAWFNLNLTNPNKILYSEDKITKEDIANYYNFISKLMLPYIKNRPLTLVRCPSSYTSCFYQKHITGTLPEALHTILIKEKNSKGEYIYLENRSGLLELSQLDVLEIHPWGAQIKNVEKPNMIIFDLDPSPEVEWKKVVEGAKLIKKYLLKFKLKSFVKTTGGKGLHIVVPIKAEYNWDEVKDFARKFVSLIEQKNPDQYISKISKVQRKGKIFIDYLRNQKGATAVAPYSTRARLHAPVSTPIAWNELTNQFEDTFFTIKTLPLRLQKLKKDPWADFFKTKQSLNLKS